MRSPGNPVRRNPIRSRRQPRRQVIPRPGAVLRGTRTRRRRQPRPRTTRWLTLPTARRPAQRTPRRSQPPIDRPPRTQSRPAVRNGRKRPLPRQLPPRRLQCPFKRTLVARGPRRPDRIPVIRPQKRGAPTRAIQRTGRRSRRQTSSSRAVCRKGHPARTRISRPRGNRRPLPSGRFHGHRQRHAPRIRARPTPRRRRSAPSARANDRARVRATLAPPSSPWPAMPTARHHQRPEAEKATRSVQRRRAGSGQDSDRPARKHRRTRGHRAPINTAHSWHPPGPATYLPTATERCRVRPAPIQACKVRRRPRWQTPDRPRRSIRRLWRA